MRACMMQTRFKPFVAAILFALFAGFLLTSGLAMIPFHPDEASLLYESQDFERWLLDPLALAWPGEGADDPQLEFRLLNAPLGKYVLGAGRLAAGYSLEQTNADWDWSLTWAENVDAGALPPERMLVAARSASSLVMWAGLLILTIVGYHLGGPSVGVCTALLGASNALLLLHGRRAMSEGTLLLGISLALLGILHADRRPWLTGLGVGLAIASKYSALPILFIGLVASVWQTPAQPASARGRLRRAAIFLATCTLVLIALHPVLWRRPIQTLGAMWSARDALLTEQVEAIGAFAPHQVLDSPGERFAALLGHVFILPPQLEEVGNYTAVLKPSFEAYLALPISSLLRGVLAGGFMMGLALLGGVVVLQEWRRTGMQAGTRGALLLLLTTGIFCAALLAVNPLPFQRYYLPLVPLIVLWQSYGIVRLVEFGLELLRGSDGA
jgi:4-amino-4-deoxy-L-arabinose transferase-like glycosyltransferase